MSSDSYPLMRAVVRTLRIQKGWTQERLAEEAGLDPKYYQRFELGQTSAPTVATLERLAKALGTKPWVLLCDDERLVLARTQLHSLDRRPAKPGRPAKR